MNKIIFKVEGMMCTGCENRIKTSISNIPGIKEVKADHVKKCVEVTADKKVTMDSIKITIEDLGFEVIDVLGE